MEKVRINLKEKTADALPENVIFEKAKRQGNSWSSASSSYFDEEENEYKDEPEKFYVEFSLLNYPFDVVYLSRAYSRMVQLDEPIKIEIDLSGK